MAYDILKGYGYDARKIPLVQECIKKHRGSVNLEKNSLEELCVADADAISHFDSIPDLLYLAYVQKGWELKRVKEFVKEKLKKKVFKKLIARESKILQVKNFKRLWKS